MAKVLIVEDDPTIQAAYQVVLGDAGHEVAVANDGVEALAQVAKQVPDIILLDMLMPNMNGLEFLRKFDLKSNTGTKVIVFSNMSIPESVAEAKSLGVSEYLTKSRFTPKEVVAAVNKLAGKK